MKKFGIVFAICVVIALGVLCFLIINSEDPYLNTNKVISNNISPAHSSDVVENTPSPTALNDAPQENEDKKDEDEDENKQDVNINKKVIAKDELGKDVIGTEYEDGTYVVSGTGDMYNFSLINGDVCFTKGKEQIIRRALRNVKKIIVANGVKSIGSMSFYDATAMTEIEISDTVTKIGDYAFMNCVNVKNITIPKGVVEIGRQAFKKCINLSGVTVAYDVQKIGEYAFEDCNNLTSVIFFEGL